MQFFDDLQTKYPSNHNQIKKCFNDLHEDYTKIFEHYARDHKKHPVITSILVFLSIHQYFKNPSILAETEAHDKQIWIYTHTQR